MTKIQWFFLWLLFIGYLFMGASVFYYIERSLEEQRRIEAIEERNEIHDLLELSLAKDSDYSKALIFSRLTDYCGKSFSKVELSNSSSGKVPEDDEPYTWSFYNSFFFSLTTLSTIGYGNISPSSDKGRLLMILYALIGIPFNGIVLAQLGDFFGSVFLRAHHRYKNHIYETCMPLVLDIILYLVPGLLIIIIVPALMFAHFEGWSIVESIYYAFVTLTTIGFGDFVAGQRAEKGNVLYTIYKVVLVIWVMFGLGYLVMVMGFISRGLRSKRVHKLEHKLAFTIKQTRSKIWNEFVQDISHVRRVLNEMYLLKVKPVYKLEVELGRSHSCPNFKTWPTPRSEEDSSSEDEEVTTMRRRRRAFSEHVTTPKFGRVMSESHLDMIDMKATFDNASIQTIESKQILAKVVDAFRPTTHSDKDSQKGVNCFTDDEILASEEYSSTKTSVNGVIPKRGRAYSCITPYHLEGSGYPEQKTWSGNESLRQFILRNNMSSSTNVGPHKTEETPTDTPTSSASSLRRMSVAAMNFLSLNNLANKWKKKSSKDLTDDREDTIVSEKNAKNIFAGNKRMSLPNNIYPQFDEFSHQTYAGERRPSIVDAFLTLGSNGEGTSNKISPVLEQTSVADFIRLLSSVESLRSGEEKRELSLVSMFKEIQEITSGAAPMPSDSQRENTVRPNGGSLSSILMESRRNSVTSGSVGSLGGERRRRFSQLPEFQAVTRVRKRAASISQESPLVRNPLRASVTMVPTPLELTRVTPPGASAKVRPVRPRRPTRSSLQPPSLVITTPDGNHRFSIQSTQLDDCHEELNEVVVKP